MAEVEAAVFRFGRAFAEADFEVLSTLLTENYIHINGRTGNLLRRADWLRWVDSRRAEIDAGELVVSSYEIESLLVQMYGESAVVTGLVRSAGTRNGDPFRSSVRFTNLWVNEAGRWRRAAFHDSPLAVEASSDTPSSDDG